MSTVSRAAHADDRRRNAERRRFRPSVLNTRHLGIGGRRKIVRRTDRGCHICTDWYEGRFLFLASAIVLLGSLDAAMTLVLIKQHGAIELNLVMAELINRGEQDFINAKIALTSLGVIPLVVYRDFNIYKSLKVAGLMVILLGIYTAVVLYELILLISH